MKRLLWAAAIATSTFVAPSAQAAWYTGTIYKVQIAPNGSFTVYLESGANNECGSTHVRFANTNAASLRMVFAAVLAYEAQGIPVQFSIQSCEGIYGVFEYIEST